MAERQIFRKKSVDRLATPERLDQLLRVIRPHTWVITSTVGVGLALALVWATLGRIPVTASGTAILVRPKQVIGLQSPAAGPIKSIEVQVGDQVEQGTLLARLSLPELEKELEQERAKLELFTSRTTELTDLEREYAKSQLDVIEQNKNALEDRVESVRRAAYAQKAETDKWIATERASIAAGRDNLDETRAKIDASRALTERMAATLQERVEVYETLSAEHLSSKDILVEPRTAVIENQLRLAELDLRRQDLDVEEQGYVAREQALNLRVILAQAEFDAQKDLMKDLELDLNDLKLKELEISQKLRADELANSSEREAIERRIAQLETRLENEGRVVSFHGGRVLELTAAIGQHVTVGERIGKMEIEDPSAELTTLAFFEIKDGKKIRPDQRIRVSPSTVARERFGGILGQVVSVTDYPVTTDAAANQIGDAELARTLLGGQSRIGVVASLDADESEHTKYAWTGRGPDDVEITAGTTAQVRVTIEEVRPITLVLPFLKSVVGG